MLRPCQWRSWQMTLAITVSPYTIKIMVQCLWLRQFLSSSFTYSLHGGCIYVSRFGLTSWISYIDVMLSQRTEEICPYNHRELSSFFQGQPWPRSIRLGLPWPTQVSSMIWEWHYPYRHFCRHDVGYVDYMFRHFILLILILLSCGWPEVHDIFARHTT